MGILTNYFYALLVLVAIAIGVAAWDIRRNRASQPPPIIQDPSALQRNQQSEQL
jgi:hypothetical protein